MDSIGANTGMNKLLLLAVLLLLCFGIVTVYTASAPVAASKGLPLEFFMLKHLQKVAIGLVLMVFFAKFFDYGYLAFWGRIIFAVGVILTIAALFLPAVNGAHRWIFGIQPSEIMKFGLIICLSYKLSQAGSEIKTVKCTLIQPGILFGITALLLVLQPNYSMLAIVSITVICVMFIAGTNKKYLIISLLVGISSAAYMLTHTEHSSKRIDAFLGEGSDASVWQGEFSLRALGNGGWTGTGAGMGLIKNGNYLPEAHKDVIYSVIGEEFGFVATFLVLLIFAVIFSQGLNIARNSFTRFGRYMALFFTFFIFLNFTVHICVCVGLMPTTGQPLPFLSFGGTNLLFNCAAIGIMLNISKSNSGKRINEPYMNEDFCSTEMFKNFDFTRSGV